MAIEVDKDIPNNLLTTGTAEYRYFEVAVKTQVCIQLTTSNTTSLPPDKCHPLFPLPMLGKKTLRS